MYASTYLALKRAQDERDAAQNYARQDAEAAKGREELRNAYLKELNEKDPNNIFYSIDHIKGVLKAFYEADRNLDGHVTLDELMNFYRPTDQEACENILKCFREAEVDGNNKLSLGEFFILGFIGAERKEGYGKARKI
ncbi:hypothetical protein BGW36DRAFT_371052 [Talaromyces proteolyticus]|uniref:EF-hand domain-containing protein n=1 Tax=Talaromyces proteolyticus TaxID=1131652 RepID=A0AAD4Q391_9EURO|nr:uncharacterized protein BGW36DRAFT_371052 [Talaromyces proteolyticus]KAH8701498.1 hypothetical protein BGW36DRAFT_371052 [Talaromyces proteolyticus]